MRDHEHSKAPIALTSDEEALCKSIKRVVVRLVDEQQIERPQHEERRTRSRKGTGSL